MPTTTHEHASAEHTGALSTEKITYRGFAKFNEKGEITETRAAAEAQAKDAESGVAVNWKKLLDNGWTQLNENDFIRYTVKTVQGFHMLVPSEEQRLYIIQSGLNYIQNAKANAAMVALKEGTTEPESNAETIDLREGINEPPSRRSLSDQQKLEKLLAGLNLSKEQKAALLLSLAQTVSAEPEAEG